MSGASEIPDVLANGLRVLFCGINPGRVSAAAGAHFANPRNDFWRLLHAAGFTSRQLEPHEQFELLEYGIGVTNAAERTTRGSGDLRRADFADAHERLDRLARELHPAWIGFVGKEAYRGVFNERADFGAQERRLGETRLWVLPSTSPANAAVPWEERLRWFTALAKLSEPVVRPAVRAVIVDADRRILLHRFVAPGDTGVWVTPGGAADPGEDDDTALRRELREELTLERVHVGRALWRRRHVWAWRGIVYDTRETYFLVDADTTEMRPTSHDSFFAGGDADEQWRWWSAEEIAASTDTFAPRRLSEHFRRLIDEGAPREAVDVGI